MSELAVSLPNFPLPLEGVGIRVAQLGFGAQATCWWAVALHEAVMPNDL